MQAVGKRGWLIAVRAVLVIAFVGSIGWIVLGWPLSFRLWFLLAIVAGGSLALFLRLRRRNPLPDDPWKQPVTAGVACTTLLAALVAVPALDEPTHEPQVTPEPQVSPEPVPPILDIAIAPGADRAEFYALPVSAPTLRDAPTADDGCDSEERHSWIVGKGGVPTGQEVYVYFETRREDAVVVISQVKINVRRAKGQYITAAGPCPDWGTGGELNSRSVQISLGGRPKVKMLDEDRKELRSLSLELEKGNAAEVLFSASVRELGAGYDWSADITYIFEGQVKQTRIPEHGWYRAAALINNPYCWSDVATPRVVRAKKSDADWCEL